MHIALTVPEIYEIQQVSVYTKLKFTETDYFRKIYRCKVQVNLNVYIWTSGTLAI